METLVQDYLLDEDDNIASVAMQGQGGDAGMSSAQMEPDLADGDDIVFYNSTDEFVSVIEDIVYLLCST